MRVETNRRWKMLNNCVLKEEMPPKFFHSLSFFLPLFLVDASFFFFIFSFCRKKKLLKHAITFHCRLLFLLVVSWKVRKHKGIKIDIAWPRHAYILTYQGSFITSPYQVTVYIALFFLLTLTLSLSILLWGCEWWWHKNRIPFCNPEKSWSIASYSACWNFPLITAL